MVFLEWRRLVGGGIVCDYSCGNDLEFIEL